MPVAPFSSGRRPTTLYTLRLRWKPVLLSASRSSSGQWCNCFHAYVRCERSGQVVPLYSVYPPRANGRSCLLGDGRSRAGTDRRRPRPPVTRRTGEFGVARLGAGVRLFGPPVRRLPRIACPCGAFRAGAAPAPPRACPSGASALPVPSSGACAAVNRAATLSSRDASSCFDASPGRANGDLKGKAMVTYAINRALFAVLMVIGGAAPWLKVRRVLAALGAALAVEGDRTRPRGAAVPAGSQRQMLRRSPVRRPAALVPRISDWHTYQPRAWHRWDCIGSSKDETDGAAPKGEQRLNFMPLRQLRKCPQRPYILTHINAPTW